MTDDATKPTDFGAMERMSYGMDGHPLRQQRTAPPSRAADATGGHTCETCCKWPEIPEDANYREPLGSGHSGGVY